MTHLQRENCAENNRTNCFTRSIVGFFKHPETLPCDHLPQKFSYIFRRKSRWELTRISAIVSGIEFCYAAETAFVTPVLLSLGLHVRYVSMMWSLSPLIAFIITPILGSLSDSCNSSFGRRRPFIILLSVGILIGLVFVPYGGRLGLLLGDKPDIGPDNVGGNRTNTSLQHFANSTDLTAKELSKEAFFKAIKMEMLTKNRIYNDSFFNLTAYEDEYNNYLLQTLLPNISRVSEEFNPENNSLDLDAETFDHKTNVRHFGIALTVIGTVFLDLCADVCQSPCRAYLLDITLPEEHATGLTIFCLNSGLGASIGYVIAAAKWDVKLWKNVLEGQVIVTFTVITVLFVFFLGTSLYSFPEIPMSLLKNPLMYREYQEKMMKGQYQSGTEMTILPQNHSEYSTIKGKTTAGVTPENRSVQEVNGSAEGNRGNSTGPTSSNHLKTEEQETSLKEYLKSIFFMPKFLRILCLTCFFYGMAVFSFTIFFTDFVGECVFGGNPRAPKDSKSYEIYKEGVRFGCWGFAFSAFCSAAFSSVIEDVVKKFGAKVVFVGVAVLNAVGMVLMAITSHKISAILLSSICGVMLSTVSTMPYIFVAHYHTSAKIKENVKKDERCTRGLGTDVATVISVLVLAQCILTVCMGTVVEAVGSNIVTVYSAALFSACGAIVATQVVYFDM